MTYGDLVTQTGFDEDSADAIGERLSLGVAARLSRYLQVLTQARKMGKDTISSQELSDYTHINSTQIRRDLSGFGKFGKRGVGYNVDALVGQIRRILGTAGQHNIALFGAGHLGRAIASSDIFADHGFRVVAIFDSDREIVGQRVGSQVVRHNDELQVGRRAGGHRRRRPRRSDAGRPGARRRPRRRRGEDNLQLLRGPAQRAAGRHRPHVEPGGRPALRAVLLPHVMSPTPAPAASRRGSRAPFGPATRGSREPRRARSGGRDLRGLAGSDGRHRGGVRDPRSRNARPRPPLRGPPGLGEGGGSRARTTTSPAS